MEVIKIYEGETKTENIKECLNLIIKLDFTLKSYGNKYLRTYTVLGETLLKLKSFNKKKYKNLLEVNKINYSVSYIDALIRISKLVSNHPSILYFSVSIHFFNKHYKDIKELCIKNSW